MSSKVIKWFKRQASIRRFTEKSDTRDEKTSSSKNSSDDKRKTGFARLSFRKRNKKKSSGVTELEGTRAIVGISKQLSYSVPNEMERGTKDISVSVPTNSISLENSSYTCSPSKSEASKSISEVSCHSFNNNVLSNRELSDCNLTDNAFVNAETEDDGYKEIFEADINIERRKFQLERTHENCPHFKTSKYSSNQSKDQHSQLAAKINDTKNAPLAIMEEICEIAPDREHPEETPACTNGSEADNKVDSELTFRGDGISVHSGEIQSKDIMEEQISVVELNECAISEKGDHSEKVDDVFSVENNENSDDKVIVDSKKSDSENCINDYVNIENKDIVNNNEEDYIKQNSDQSLENENSDSNATEEENIFEEIDKLVKNAQSITDFDTGDNVKQNAQDLKETRSYKVDETIENKGVICDPRLPQSEISEKFVENVDIKKIQNKSNIKIEIEEYSNGVNSKYNFDQRCNVDSKFNEDSTVCENECVVEDKLNGKLANISDVIEPCCKQKEKSVEIVITHPSPKAKPNKLPKSSQGSSYPEELNPFGEDEPEPENHQIVYDGNANIRYNYKNNKDNKVMPLNSESTKENGTNPFGDEDELHEEYSLLRKTKTKYYIASATSSGVSSVRKNSQTGAENKSLNPFDEEDDEVTPQEQNPSNPFDEDEDDEDRTRVNADETPPCLPPKSDVQRRKNSGSLAPVPHPRKSKQSHHGSCTSLQNISTFPIPAPRSITPFGSTKTLLDHSYLTPGGEEEQTTGFERQGLGRNSIQSTGGVDPFGRHPIRGSLPPSLRFRSGRKKRQAPLPPGVTFPKPSTSSLSVSSTATCASSPNNDQSDFRSKNRSSSSPPSAVETSERRSSTSRGISPGRLPPPRPPPPPPNDN